ncbi:ribbon-helix-helix protein, CopG family [Candidatus Poribacteria bacterium]|nr:ribbon-helix-helix protein, CopG family [Candidatus Poribacteria bacterium]
MAALKFQKLAKSEEAVKLTIRIPKTLKEQVEEAAYQSRKSITLFIREALEKALREQGATT